MKILKLSAAAAVVLLVVLAIAAPIGPLPGFFIGGTPAPAPSTWPDTSGVHEIRLRVPGTLPRVVVIWVVDHQGALHVVGAEGSGWVSMLGDGGPVDMRLGDETYALKAVRLTDGWQPVLEAYVDKYRTDYPEIVAGFPDMAEAEGQVAVFRLDRG